MVAAVPPSHDSPAIPAPMRTGRASWLILAADGPAIEVPDRVPSTVVRVIADPRRFRDVLLAERPRIVLCAQPPADAEALHVVAEERRRRSGMRAIHLAPPDAVAERLAALAAGLRRRAGDDDRLAPSWPAASRGSRRRPGRGPAPPSSCRSATGSRSTWRRTSCVATARSSTSGQRSSACWRSSRRTRAAPTPAASCCTWSGGRAMRAAHGPWTSTSAGCARRSSRCPITPPAW